jgi:hypothetical protein
MGNRSVGTVISVSLYGRIRNADAYNVDAISFYCEPVPEVRLVIYYYRRSIQYARLLIFRAIWASTERRVRQESHVSAWLVCCDGM